MNTHKPQILAPAGSRQSFFAALAAGADAVYAGLKLHSARMQADNFSVAELAVLREMAEARDAKLYVPVNAMVKPGELAAAGRLLHRLATIAKPHALIVQDPGVIELARQAGYAGEIHLSTLANVSHPAPLAMLREKLGASRVIVPRELTIDEIRQMAEACPEGLDLEVFVHGALCYGVSGRCWWSSFFGGKSGLRGRCVQPCRRIYSGKGKKARLFSCRDLSLDILAKTLLSIPQVACWKIEGRKKGPHYVFYTVSAYKLLRDNPDDPAAKKQAMDYISQALGRPGTHYSFLPQKPHPAVTPEQSTASGLFVGKAGRPKKGLVELTVREPLVKGDVLRVGFEDEPGHFTTLAPKSVPKRGRIDLRPPKGRKAAAGVPVFVVDRREPELNRILSRMQGEFGAASKPQAGESGFAPTLPEPAPAPGGARRMEVFRRLPKGKLRGEIGLWLRAASSKETPKPLIPKLWWWLPPVVWPEEDRWISRTLNELLALGARRFVLGSPWQAAWFERPEKLTLWAGPFCNLANPLALAQAAKLGISGAFASPELPREDLAELAAASPMPLGLVTAGFWPLCISRTIAPEVAPGEPLSSPMGEVCFVRAIGRTNWVYPNWPLSLSTAEPELERAGFAIFATLHEALPKRVQRAERTSTFNLDLKLL